MTIDDKYIFAGLLRRMNWLLNIEREIADIPDEDNRDYIYEQIENVFINIYLNYKTGKMTEAITVDVIGTILDAIQATVGQIITLQYQVENGERDEMPEFSRRDLDMDLENIFQNSVQRLLKLEKREKRRNNYSINF